MRPPGHPLYVAWWPMQNDRLSSVGKKLADHLDAGAGVRAWYCTRLCALGCSSDPAVLLWSVYASSFGGADFQVRKAICMKNLSCVYWSRSPGYIHSDTLAAKFYLVRCFAAVYTSLSTRNDGRNTETMFN